MSGMRKYMIIGSILIIGYLLVQYFRPLPTNWKSTYLPEDKIPFGTYILRQQFKAIYPGTSLEIVRTPIYGTLKNQPKTKSNYLIIASRVNIDKRDYGAMKKYMELGNSIFIAAYQIDGVLLDTLKLNITTDFSLGANRKYPVNFVNPNLKRELDYYFDKGISGQYFDSIDTPRTIVLGQRLATAANFVQIRYGKGSLYILPNPQLLTNYSLLKEDGRDYAAKTLSYLPKAEKLIWDEHFIRPDEQDRSTLSVFFKYKQFRWAYYIALFSLVGFVLYEIKRRQRIIPVIDRLKNTSVEFATVVGRVYYHQHNNRDIAEKKVVYLLEYIRNKYRLKTTELDEGFEQALLRISGASAETLEDLFTAIRILQNGGKVTDQKLVNLNKVIEEFYQQDQ